ncbi:MAG: hypothetical protein ACPF9K_13250, partial [Neptuniibacter sp.]
MNVINNILSICILMSFCGLAMSEEIQVTLKEADIERILSFLESDHWLLVANVKHDSTGGTGFTPLTQKSQLGTDNRAVVISQDETLMRRYITTQIDYEYLGENITEKTSITGIQAKGWQLMDVIPAQYNYEINVITGAKSGHTWSLDHIRVLRHFAQKYID